LVEKSDIRFFYLSCCQGTATAAQNQLLDDDFLGITDALIQAGVPSALGFRWPVSDQGAVELAVGFYDTLARDGRLDVALLEARKKIDRDDLTWLSPVLIAQK
jgi:CHAT domain-containing protein